MTEFIAGVEVPETELVREATSLVRDAAEEAVFHHSRRSSSGGERCRPAHGIGKWTPNSPTWVGCSMIWGG